MYPGVGSTRSFEQLASKHVTASSASAATPSTRFAPQQGFKQEKEMAPEAGALQFVPAFEGSWDAEEKKEDVAVRKAAARGVGGSSQRGSTAVPKKTLSGESTVGSTATAGSKRGNRIQRLASLFSSRAVVRTDTKQSSSPKGQHKAAKQTPPAAVPQQRRQTSTPVSSVPPSPANSGSSSGFVGWPGTQDKRGATVAIPASYDEGSLVGAPAMNSSGNDNNNNSYEQELHEAAAREMNRWTGSKRASPDGFSSVGSYTPSPIQSMDGRLDERYSPAAPTTNEQNPADFHLAAAVADANVAASSPYRQNMSAARYVSAGHGNASVAASESVSFHDLFPGGNNHSGGSQQSPHHIWAGEEESSSRVESSTSGTDLSKTSSAYFNSKEMAGLEYPELDYNPYEGRRNEQAAAEVIRRKQAAAAAAIPQPTGPQPPTADALANNDHLQPPHRSFNAPGYHGLINKTKEVPSLMDDMDSDSMASSKATTTYSSVAPSQVRRARVNSDAESDVFDDVSLKDSDVFDNLSHADNRSGASPRKAPSKRNYPERIVEENESTGGQDDFKLVLLGGGLTAIQTPQGDFTQRQTAVDFDENLTDSDIDQFGFARIPGFHEMASAGLMRNRNSLEGIHGNLGASPRRDPYGRGAQSQSDDMVDSESGSSLFSDPYGRDDMDGDLSEYYVQPATMKKLVRRYRKLSERIDTDLSLSDFEREEDEHKAFAMFEMRSRIMEKDIERGLERRGGTVAVDDLVTTPYNRTAQRIRDAVIVSKAWRDGASPTDVINTALLTRRAAHSHFIKRPIQGGVNDSASSSYSTSSQRYYWEAVKWVDDADFMQYRCPSLGSRHMRGFEMFTIGDCQSILLKLTNERCQELRLELNAATKRQIIAEELMKDDSDASDEDMTESEFRYLSAMEEVKGISKKLVVAEQSFTLVRDRVEKLVAKYEALLVKFDTESFAASSIVTCDSSYYSEYDSEYWEAEEEREKVVWARRAQRAELRAELAAREALLAKQEARMIKEEKQRELEELRQKLQELQSEASQAIVEKEHSVILARSFAMRRNDPETPESTHSGRISKGKVDSVKQRFRDRMAAKKQQSASPAAIASPYGAMPRSSPQYITPSPPPHRNSLFRQAGEEMYQHLDFYERSLKAVDGAQYSR